MTLGPVHISNQNRALESTGLLRRYGMLLMPAKKNWPRWNANRNPRQRLTMAYIASSWNTALSRNVNKVACSLESLNLLMTLW